MFRPQSGDRPGNSRVIGVEKSGATQRDFLAVGQIPRSIQRLPIECRCRAQLSSGLPRIQRRAGRIPIAINNGA